MKSKYLINPDLGRNFRADVRKKLERVILRDPDKE